MECKTIAQEVYSNCLPMTGATIDPWLLFLLAALLIVLGFGLRRING